ncbi:MAG: DNA polymerase III subunit epsilon [Algicola sp.]|nr:DNA polymerase III subunit epsilon [Algicola sp.]
MEKRQVVLDTETTGIDPKQGHRIIEIGCVELINRRFTGNNYHVYVNPERIVEQEAIDVHGITNDFLRDKPKYREISQEFFDYINGAELVIHNSAFDIGFMDHEFRLLDRNWAGTAQYCAILDTLAMARKKHPGQRATLDSLCKKYGINNAHRELHGALLDAEILADVYLLMSGGQIKFNLSSGDGSSGDTGIRRLSTDRQRLKVIAASADELTEHEQRLDLVDKKGGSVIWRN